MYNIWHYNIHHDNTVDTKQIDENGGKTNDKNKFDVG